MSSHGIAFSPKKRAEDSLNEQGNDMSIEQAHISRERGTTECRTEERKHMNSEKKLHGKSAIRGNMAPDAKQNIDRSTAITTGRRATTPTKDQLYGNAKIILGSRKKDVDVPRKPAGSKLRAKSVEEFERVLQSWQPSQTVIPSPHRAPPEMLERESESAAEVLKLEDEAPIEPGGVVDLSMSGPSLGQHGETKRPGSAETQETNLKAKEEEEEEEEELDLDVDIELQRELRKMEKRIQTQLSIVMLQAVEAMGERLLLDAEEREREERAASLSSLQDFLRRDALTLQEKMATAVSGAVAEAMAEAVAERGVPTKFVLSKLPEKSLVPFTPLDVRSSSSPSDRGGKVV